MNILLIKITKNINYIWKWKFKSKLLHVARGVGPNEVLFKKNWIHEFTQVMPDAWCICYNCKQIKLQYPLITWNAVLSAECSLPSEQYDLRTDDLRTMQKHFMAFSCFVTSFFTVQFMALLNFNYWNRLSREAVLSPNLEGFKIHLDKVESNLAQSQN